MKLEAILTIVLCAAAILLFGMFLSFTTVPAGHVGVITTFGSVNQDTLESGFHWVAPWRKVHHLSLQTQEDKEVASVPTKEGLSVEVEVSLLYSLQKSSATTVFSNVGINYNEIVVTPIFKSAMRSAAVTHEAKDLYTAQRTEIEDTLERTVRTALEKQGVLCEKVLLRSIQLPKTVKDAIEKKLAAEQAAQQMDFVIQKETKEAERKRVEAKGIADSQKIIQGTLTDNYLRYLWIKSLEMAATHSGTIIYVPTGGDGMPFIKNVDHKK